MMGSKVEEKNSYYDSGSNKATELTAVTLKKLEQRRKLTAPSERIVICLVGLPGRGKSFIARKLHTFLNWRGIKCKVFNVGKYRRAVQAEHEQQLDNNGNNGNDSSNSTNDNDGGNHGNNENGDESSKIREKVGACDANFFDSNNPQAKALRERSAQMALEDMLKWLDDDESTSSNTPPSPKSNIYETQQQSGLKAISQLSRMAIFDATNSTAQRRNWVLSQCTSPTTRGSKLTGVIFVESICDDAELLDENFKFKVQNSPDFEGMSNEEAIRDLKERVKKYEEQYETIREDNLSYIKIFNLSSKLLVNHIYGRMAKVVVPCLMSWNIGSRPIYLCRAGDTKMQTEEQSLLGYRKKMARGDILGENGKKFRDRLEQFILDEGVEFRNRREGVMREVEAFTPTDAGTGTSVSGLASAFGVQEAEGGVPFACHLMTSTMPRAVETATWESLPFLKAELPNLNPLDKGDFSGMELSEIKEQYPDWYKVLEEDPFLTRFPGGECYRDLIHRLETCIIDMEQQVNMACVVSHVSVLQVLIAYFRRTPIEKCASIQVPMHTVIKFSPVTGGGWTESQHHLGPDGDCDSLNSNSDTERECATPIWGDHIKQSNSDEMADYNLCCNR